MLAVEHRAVASLNPQSQWHPDQQAGTCETLSFLSTHLTTSSCKCPSPLNCSYRMDRAQALQQNIDYYQQQQAQLLADINRCLSEATHGHQQRTPTDVSVSGIQAQIQTLGLLSHARSYVERLKRTAEQVRQLERQIRPASHTQDALQLAELAAAAAEQYTACVADVEALASCSYSEQAVPEQLRSMEQQLRARLEAAQSTLRGALSQHIHMCLAQCGWPPPLTESQAAGDGNPGQMFSTAHADAINTLQHLMKALTRLQMAAERDAITAALQSNNGSFNSPSTSIAGPEPPLLWVAQELAAPLCSQMIEVFGSSAPGSPGALNTPEIMLAVVHRLAVANCPRIDFLQGILQGLELHSIYQIGVEFTRALRDAVKQLLRQYKLPEVAASGDRDLWLAWIDALRDFEGSIGRSSLLGFFWDSNTSSGELPVLLLRGSTLSVLGENPEWMDAWLQAESDSARKQVEAVLYSPEGWNMAQSLVAEDCPAWEADSWQPQAAEEVVALVQAMLERLRFIPDPTAQQRYLQGAVAAVLSEAHGRIIRILQQAELFKNITGPDLLFKVCPCICFCHYVEQQLQEMHDNAEILVTRIMEEKQELLQQQQQNGDGQSSHPQQQQEHMLSNGHSSYDGQQQRQSTASANGGPYGPRGSSSGGSLLQQQQRQITLETAALAAMAAAATTKLRVLSRVISDFSSCRREWVLKLGKAIATGFMHKASGYVSRGALFKATSEALPAMAAQGELWSSGVVSGELQVALAWLAALLEQLSHNLDKHCFRQAWGAAAAAINRELFNNVACEAYFSDAGALQLQIDQQALLGVFRHYTQKPGSYFRELGDAIRLLNLPRETAEFLRQVVSGPTRAPNAIEVLKANGIHHLDPDLADTVMSLRLYQ